MFHKNNCNLTFSPPCIVIHKIQSILLYNVTCLLKSQMLYKIVQLKPQDLWENGVMGTTLKNTVSETSSQGGDR